MTQETLLGPVPLSFVLFALTLLGVAVLHHHVLKVALCGLAAVLMYQLGFAGLSVAALLSHLQHEWVIIANLFALLTGFAILSRHFEKTRIPALLPRYLADDWKGGFQLLVLVFILSGFLDNIAAAMIGGAMAHTLFQGRVHIGYLAALVAAANAGGAGSVIGDTTTTMIWLQGVSPLAVLEAYIAAFFALVVFGIPAARLQQAYSPIVKNSHAHTQLDWPRLGIVLAMLLAVIGCNVGFNLLAPQLATRLPWIGLALWVVILLSYRMRRPDWEVLPQAAKGAVFLLALVLCASLMPVAALPPATVTSTFGLGFISAVFDNIPLTALALAQGGYDWGFLAFAVGFGGSMLWFGSSAGVALSNLYPEAKSVFKWVRFGWPIIAGYAIGYGVLTLLLGWHPT
jgi:Na+/H+ antiporter NhaD/arsenite permease-like protein